MTSPTISPPESSPRSAIRRWVDDRIAASAVEARELSVSTATPSQSFAIAVSLLGLFAEMHGWPPPPDLVDERDNLEVWERFSRLRARLHP